VHLTGFTIEIDFLCWIICNTSPYKKIYFFRRNCSCLTTSNAKTHL